LVSADWITRLVHLLLPGRFLFTPSYQTFGAAVAVAIGVFTAFAAIAFRWLIETFDEISSYEM